MQGIRSAHRTCRPAPGQAHAGPAPSAWRLTLAGMGVTVLAALSVMAISSLVAPSHAQDSVPDTMRQKALIRLVRQECGFCHGLRLTGGLGSPLTAEAMGDRPAEAMVATILYGRGGTAMPGWAPFLSEAEAEWIVARLKEGLPQ